MSTPKEKLSNMFAKVMAGTVTREEGTMLLNHMAKEDLVGTITELSSLLENPPPNVFPKTILHTIALTKNKAFFNIIVASLTHKNEDVCILAAEELARQRTDDARHVLIEQLSSEAYHIRKASAAALAKGFGKDGTEILKKHILSHPEQFFRDTSAYGLVLSGSGGITALIELLNSGSSAAAATAASALTEAAAQIKDEHLPKIFGALLGAGDRKDSQTIIVLLKLIAALRHRAQSFEGYVLAFKDYPFEPVRHEAENTLRRIRPSA